jgi:DNA-binding SARP family transcriptional activator
VFHQSLLYFFKINVFEQLAKKAYGNSIITHRNCPTTPPDRVATTGLYHAGKCTHATGEHIPIDRALDAVLNNLLYYDWAIAERRRLNEAYLTALQRLAVYRATTGNYKTALKLVQQILQYDLLREDIHCQALLYYSKLGDRRGIIVQYKHLVKLLTDDLDTSLLPTTRELCQSLLVEIDERLETQNTFR